MEWSIFKKPNQATPGSIMCCPTTGIESTVKRRGRVEGRVGILIEFINGNDVTVVEAKNRWLVKSSSNDSTTN